VNRTFDKPHSPDTQGHPPLNDPPITQITAVHPGLAVAVAGAAASTFAPSTVVAYAGMLGSTTTVLLLAATRDG